MRTLRAHRMAHTHARARLGDKGKRERALDAADARRLFCVVMLGSCVCCRSALLAFLEKERPHVLCIGETKLQESHLRDVEVQLRELLPGHTAHWAVSVPPAKKGYSGLVALVEDSLHAQLPGGCSGGLTADARERAGAGGAASGGSGGGGENAKKDGTKQQSISAMFAKAGGKQTKATREAAEAGAGGGPVGLASVVEGLGARSSGGTFEPFEREYNAEGRTLTLDMGSFALVCAYVPNSGADLVRLDYRIDVWEEDIKAHMAALGKPVVYMGDLNVAVRLPLCERVRARLLSLMLTRSPPVCTSGVCGARAHPQHLDLDIWNVGAKHLEKSAGTTPREREAFGALLDAGYVDTFRALHPDARHAYTFWSVRARNRPWNRGLRLDYVLASANMAPVDGEGAPSQALPRVMDSWVGPEYNTNGDHCPVGATIALPSTE